MPIKILMPTLSPTMNKGNLARWLKKEGDKISIGDVLAEIETDKAVMEIEAVDEGILAKIVIPSGTEDVTVNSLIAVLAENGEDIALAYEVAKAAVDDQVENSSDVLQEKIVEDNRKKESAEFIEGSKKDRLFASPLAKSIAKINNIDLRNISGSGPHGRIVKRDVLSASDLSTRGTISAKGAIKRVSEEYYLVPNNNIRKIIAERLLESKQQIPHFYLSVECHMDKLLEMREDINKSFGDDKALRISVNDFVILAVARALKEVPEANASWEGSATKYYNNIDVSVAVALDSGLITPVIRNADQKNILDLSSEMKSLIKRARDNKLTLEEFQGGGFSISNLGMYGIKNFNPIINPPQSCIMGVGSVSKRPAVQGDQIVIASVMDINLSCDHRVVDGAVGAKFLTVFKKFIENPVLLLI